MCVSFLSFVVLCWLYTSDSATTVKSHNDAGYSVKGDIAYPDDLDISKMSRRSYILPYHSPDFQHDPEFHRQHPHFHHHHPYHNFNEGPNKNDHTKSTQPDASSSQIPLEFIQGINEYNVSDLLLHYIDGAEGRDIFIEDRFGDDEGQEKSASSAIMAKDAKCMPELQTVKIASSEDPSVLYIPQCTRVERCGGCCKHDLLSCQPIEKETVSFKVFKTKYTGEKKLKFLGNEVVFVEKHNKCTCDCRIKEKDCTSFQQYRKTECQCVCINNDEKKKCLKNSGSKLWNPDLCTCQCRDILQCSTGSYFDQNECKCLPVPMKRRFAADYDQKTYIYEAAPIVPIED